MLNPTVYKVGAEPELYTIEYNDTAIDATEEIIKGNIAPSSSIPIMAKQELKHLKQAQISNLFEIGGQLRGGKGKRARTF